MNDCMSDFFFFLPVHKNVNLVEYTHSGSEHFPSEL